MATPRETYTNPIYAAVIEAYNIGDDTAPTTNEKLAGEWRNLQKTVADYKKTKDVGRLKTRVDILKLGLDNTKSLRDFVSDLNKVNADTSVATMKALVDRANTILENNTKIAATYNTYNDALFAESQKAFQDGQSGGTGARDAAETLFNTLRMKGAGVDTSQAQVSSLATQWTKMVLGEADLQKVSPQAAYQAIKDAKGSDEQAIQVKTFIESAQQSQSGLISAARGIQNASGELEATISAGAPLNAASFKKQLADATQRFETSLPSEGQINADLRAAEAEDTEYQRLLQESDMLKKAAFQPGNEGLRTRMGRLVADPEFRRWAEDNGYELGQAQVTEDGRVLYVPGRQDERAMVRFAYQARTGKQSPIPFAGRSSGELVKVTFTNEAERQRVLEASDLGNNRYAVDKDGNVVTPEVYARTSKEMGFSPSVQSWRDPATKKVYLKSGDKFYEIDKTNKALTPLDAAPAGARWEDAAIYGPDKKPVRYLREMDVSSPDALFAGGKLTIGGADATERAQIETKTPYKVVGEGALTGIGVQSVIGYRDRRNADTIGRLGEGAISVRTEGGRLEFGPGATYEVIERPRTEADDARPDRVGVRAAARAEELERAGTVIPMADREALRLRGVEAPPPVRTAPAPSALARTAGSVAEVEALERQDLTAAPGGRRVPVSGAPVGAPAAPAPAAAPAAAKAAQRPGAVYMQAKDGSVYEVSESGAREVAPAPGKTRRVGLIEAGTSEFDALTNRLGADGRALNEAEVKNLGTIDVQAPATRQPRPTVTQEGGLTRVDYDNPAPTLGQRVGAAVSGAVDRTKDAFARAAEKRRLKRAKTTGAPPRSAVERGAETSAGSLPEATTFAADAGDDLFNDTSPIEMVAPSGIEASRQTAAGAGQPALAKAFDASARGVAAAPAPETLDRVRRLAALKKELREDELFGGRAEMAVEPPAKSATSGR
jgi:hypothetical protein